MPYAEAPNVSANAGDEKTLSNPNSPESLSRKAKQAQAQSAEDQRYDVKSPAREAAGFLDYVVLWDDERKTSQEISAGLFLALSVLLFLYKAAPDQ